MTRRSLTTIAAMAALGTAALAGPAPAITRDHGDRACTRSEQRTDTTRFETRSCVRTRADRVRADLRIAVRAKLPTATAAANAAVRVRDRAREDARTGDMRIRVRTEHRRRVEDNVLRDELRVRIEVRNANHPQVAIGTAANGVLPITVTQLDAAGQTVVLRTLSVSVPQAQ